LADREIPDMSRRQPGDLAEATTSLNSGRLVAAPGTQWNYHNPNYEQDNAPGGGSDPGRSLRHTAISARNMTRLRG
jgi:hypothetical protein